MTWNTRGLQYQLVPFKHSHRFACLHHLPYDILYLYRSRFTQPRLASKEATIFFSSFFLLLYQHFPLPDTIFLVSRRIQCFSILSIELQFLSLTIQLQFCKCSQPFLIQSSIDFWIDKNFTKNNYQLRIKEKKNGKKAPEIRKNVVVVLNIL